MSQPSLSSDQLRILKAARDAAQARRSVDEAVRAAAGDAVYLIEELVVLELLRIGVPTAGGAAVPDRDRVELTEAGQQHPLD